MSVSKFITSKILMTQYDGTNGTALFNSISTGLNDGSNWTKASDTGTVLTITCQNGGLQTTVINLGDWVQASGSLPVLTNADFNANYVVALGSATDVAATVKMQEEVAAVSIPALVLGGTTSVTATLSGTFPSTAYDVRRRVFAGVSVISTLTFAETARTANSITYTVTASGVATAAAVLLVDAYKLVPA